MFAVGVVSLAFAVLSLLLLTFAVAFRLLRHGHFLAALSSVAFGLIAGIFFLFLPQGIHIASLS